MRSKPAVLAVGVAGVVFVSLFHWLARGEYQVAALALLPIAFCAWRLGVPAGVGLSALASLSMFSIDVATAPQLYTMPAVAFWNAWMHLGTFLLAAILVARLAAAYELRSRLLSLVTHEFNHSLTVVGVAISLLERTDPSAKDEKRLSIYKTIERQHATLRQLVSNFLNYNRMKAGRLTYTFKPTLTRDLVSDCVKLLTPLLEQKGLQVALEFPPEPAPVRADPDALALVVSNLIGNAVKFTDRGGKVTIRLTVPREAPGRMRFAVEDTGSGLGPDEQRRIRSGVYQADAPALTAPQGFGLGLRLAEDILRSHGSQLTIQSWPGEGSVFSFDLPVWTGPKNGA